MRILTLTILHEKRMRRNMLCVICCLSASAVYFHDYRNQLSLRVVLFVTTFAENFPILRPIKHYVINLHISSCELPIILVECKLNWNFLAGFLKHLLLRYLIKIRLVGTEWFYADRQTDRQTYRQTDKRTERERDREVNSRFFRNFANVPINYGGTRKLW